MVHNPSIQLKMGRCRFRAKLAQADSASPVENNNADEWRLRLSILFDRSECCRTFSRPFQLIYVVIAPGNVAVSYCVDTLILFIEHFQPYV